MRQIVQYQLTRDGAPLWHFHPWRFGTMCRPWAPVMAYRYDHEGD